MDIYEQLNDKSIINFDDDLQRWKEDCEGSDASTSAELLVDYAVFIPNNEHSVIGKYDKSKALDVRRMFNKDKSFVDIRSNDNVNDERSLKSEKLSHFERCNSNQCFRKLMSIVKSSTRHR